jgi:hypothetical protein
MSRHPFSTVASEIATWTIAGAGSTTMRAESWCHP